MNRSPTHWRVRQQPRKKKHSLLFLIFAGVNFFLKKERVFFFRGSAQEVSGQCVGLQYGLGKTKICFSGGKDFSFCLGCISARRRGLGRNAGGFRTGGFRRRTSYFALRNAPQKNLTGNL